MTADEARRALADDAPVRARVTLDFPAGYAWGNPDPTAVKMIVHVVAVEGDYGLAWAAIRLSGDRDTDTFPSLYAHLPLDRLDAL